MKYKNIDINELNELMLNNSLLIDVRTPIEWFSQKIPDSTLIPLSNINLDIILEVCTKKIQNNLLDSTKNINLIFYCKSGVRSIKAIEEIFSKNSEEKLESQPYNFNIYNLKQGLEAYKPNN